MKDKDTQNLTEAYYAVREAVPAPPLPAAPATPAAKPAKQPVNNRMTNRAKNWRQPLARPKPTTPAAPKPTLGQAVGKGAEAIGKGVGTVASLPFKAVGGLLKGVGSAFKGKSQPTASTSTPSNKGSAAGKALGSIGNALKGNTSTQAQGDNKFNRTANRWTVGGLPQPKTVSADAKPPVTAKPQPVTPSPNRVTDPNSQAAQNLKTTNPDLYAKAFPSTSGAATTTTPVEKPIKEPVTAVDPMADTTRSIGGKDVDVTKMADWEPAKMAYDAEQAAKSPAIPADDEFVSADPFKDPSSKPPQADWKTSSGYTDQASTTPFTPNPKSGTVSPERANQLAAGTTDLKPDEDLTQASDVYNKNRNDQEQALADRTGVQRTVLKPGDYNPADMYGSAPVSPGFQDEGPRIDAQNPTDMYGSELDSPGFQGEGPRIDAGYNVTPDAPATPAVGSIPGTGTDPQIRNVGGQLRNTRTLPDGSVIDTANGGTISSATDGTGEVRDQLPTVPGSHQRPVTNTNTAVAAAGAMNQQEPASSRRMVMVNGKLTAVTAQGDGTAKDAAGNTINMPGGTNLNPDGTQAPAKVLNRSRQIRNSIAREREEMERMQAALPPGQTSGRVFKQADGSYSRNRDASIKTASGGAQASNTPSF
jgi:hypothetical protein